MEWKTVSITPETYEALLKQKRKEESISDVIARLIGMKKEFTDYEQIFGRWKDLPSEYLEIMEAAGRDLRKDFQRRFS